MPEGRLKRTRDAYPPQRAARSSSTCEALAHLCCRELLELVAGLSPLQYRRDDPRVFAPTGAATSFPPIRSGSTLSSAAAADPPRNAHPGAASFPWLRSLMLVWISPASMTRDGTKAPSTPPMVAPHGPAGVPAAAAVASAPVVPDAANGRGEHQGDQEEAHGRRRGSTPGRARAVAPPAAGCPNPLGCRCSRRSAR